MNLTKSSQKNVIDHLICKENHAKLGVSKFKLLTLSYQAFSQLSWVILLGYFLPGWNMLKKPILTSMKNNLKISPFRLVLYPLILRLPKAKLVIFSARKFKYERVPVSFQLLIHAIIWDSKGEENEALLTKTILSITMSRHMYL